jgi:hypothetical protein
VYEQGKVPYPTMTNDQSVEAVLKGYRLPQPEACPNEVYGVMLLCWDENPKKRPKFKAIQTALTDLISEESKTFSR